MMNAAKELLTFIENSPSMFHSIETIKGMLEEAGFTYLPERTRWDVKQGGTYYTIRNHSSIIAFRVGKELGDYHFQMCASHSDSPTYKIKSVPELNGPGEYLRLDVEAYGGMIDNTWFDRPLTVAGRVLVKDGQGVSARLLYIDKDLLIIPNVAIHFNREVNNGYKYNRQVDLCPLFSAGELKKGAFDAMIAKRAWCGSGGYFRKGSLPCKPPAGYDLGVCGRVHFQSETGRLTVRLRFPESIPGGEE